MVWSVEKNGGAPPATENLRRGAGELAKFKKKVDGILRNLEGTAAGKKAVASQAISEGALSSQGYEFSEAHDLFATYKAVHTELERLSQTLGDQLECIGIAVHGADIGFDNLEEEERQRFWRLQQQVRDRNEEGKGGDKSAPTDGDSSY